MKEVKVLAKDGQKLMSTDLERANKLIAKGEAEIVEASPLTIKMLKGTKRYMQEILKEHYSYEESKNPFTIPLGKMNVNDEEKDFVWNLSLSDDTNFKSVSLLVSAKSDNDRRTLVDHVINHTFNNSKNIELIFCDVNNEYNYLKNSAGCTYIGSDIKDIADMLETVQTRMMKLFKHMEENQVNNVNKIPNFTPKDIILCISDMNSLMMSDDYVAVEKIKRVIDSIARLGRAAGINLLLLTQRLTSASISNDLMCNIMLRLVLGEFDASVSYTMFEKDISDEIKLGTVGRGFVQYNFRDIYEVQLFGDTDKEM